MNRSIHLTEERLFFCFPVPFWCSIRVAVAFVGFLGMVAHYSQKISVGIALVCMVNHTAIHSLKNASTIALTQDDIDCPRANNAIEIVRNLNCFSFADFSLIRKDRMYGRKIFKELFSADIFGVI